MERRAGARTPKVNPFFHYKLLLEYRGTNYFGWQIQPKDKTVQGELNQALKILSKSDDVKSLGSGRTDAGVHALGQVVKVSMPLEIVPENLVKALNGNLPDDIRVLEAEMCDEAFLPTVHAKSKEYHYRFTSGRGHSAFQSPLVANHPFDLDLLAMQDACRILIGSHDFTNYFCEGTEVSSYIREIFECEIFEVKTTDVAFLPPHYIFRIVGNGFLKQMVRLLVGAVWNVGRGKITLEEFQNSLTNIKGPKLGATAPAEGLYMVRVNY